METNELVQLLHTRIREYRHEARAFHRMADACESLLADVLCANVSQAASNTACVTPTPVAKYVDPAAGPVDPVQSTSDERRAKAIGSLTPPRRGSLKEYILKFLRNRHNTPRAVKDITSGVASAGTRRKTRPSRSRSVSRVPSWSSPATSTRQAAVNSRSPRAASRPKRARASASHRDAVPDEAHQPYR